MKGKDKNEKDVGEKSLLPHNRWQVFADRIKTHFGKYLSGGLLLLLFALPFFAVRFYADLTAASLYDNYVAGTLSAEEYKGALSGVTLVASLSNVAAYVIFAVGLAGVVRQIRQTAWSEPLSFWQDFAVGVKQNALPYMLIFFVTGLFNAFGVAVMQNRTDFVGHIPMCVYVLVVLPVVMHATVQVAIYNHKFSDVFGTSLFLYVKTLPVSILFSLLFTLYGVFDVFSAFAARYICKVFFVLLLPVTMLGWFLYDCSVLDKYVNKQSYPDLVDKGVWRL